jgi:hypothetical protein
MTAGFSAPTAPNTVLKHHTPAAEQRENNWKDFEDFNLKAKAKIWP